MPSIDGTPHHLSDDTPTRTLEPSGEITEKRIKRTLVSKIRKHKIENVNRNQLAQYLDKLHAEGGTVIALNISRDIGGTYEVISYKEA